MDLLDYYSSSGELDNSLRGLQLIQNPAAGVLTGINKIDHMTPALAALRWQPVKLKKKSL